MEFVDRIKSYISAADNYKQFDVLPYTDTSASKDEVRNGEIKTVQVQAAANGPMTKEESFYYLADYVNIDYTRANIWNTADEVLPLEGLFIGRELNDLERVATRVKIPVYTEASVLNLPEFVNAFYNSFKVNSYTEPYVFLLNAMPFNPPYAPLAPTGDTITNVESLEANPSMLFKNVAGIYSLPEPYIHWLGSMWNLHSGDLTFDTDSFVQVIGDANAGWENVKCTLDPDKKNTDFFRSEKYTPADAPTLMVNFDKFQGKKRYFAQLGNLDFELGSLNGFGIYEDFFYGLYGDYHSVNGTLRVPSLIFNDLNLQEANLQSKLRVFNTYRHVINSDVQVNAFGAYSIVSCKPGVFARALKSDAGENAEGTPLLTAASDPILKRYASIWERFYEELTRGTKSYNTVRDEIVSAYSGVNGTELFSGITQDLFDRSEAGSVQYNDPDKFELIKVDEWEVFKNMNLFATEYDTKYIVDLIGSMVLRFMAYQPPVQTVDRDYTDKYLVDSANGNDCFVVCLYPSAGGVNSMIYGLKKIDEFVNGIDKVIAVENGAVRVTGGRANNDFVSSMFLNMFMNACHFLWYTGPYMGVGESEQGNIHTFYNNILTDLNTNFLFASDEFTASKGELIPKERRCYMLDPTDVMDYRKRMRYSEIINYIGTALLETCAGELDSAVLKAKDIILSLMILDKSDFAPLELTAKNNANQPPVTYSIDEQIMLLTVYDNLLATGYFSGKCYNDQNNLLMVMNASLAQAQLNKAKRVCADLMSARKLVNSGSVFDYLKVNNVQNEIHYVAAVDTTNITDVGEFLKTCIFGKQAMVEFTYQDSGLTDLYVQHIPSSLTPDQLRTAIRYFFATIKVQPTETTFKIAKDFIVQYCNYLPARTGFHTQSQMQGALKRVYDQAKIWVKTSDSDISKCMNVLSTALQDINVDYVKKEVEAKADATTSDLNKLKQRTYYNVKALYDNWISIDPTTKDFRLIYNYNSIPFFNDLEVPSLGLAEHFLFLDRANRDIGDNLLVNLDWLTTFFNNNFGYGNNTNISLYSFLSELGKAHSSLIHALPAFIDLSGFGSNAAENNYAGQLFDTYTYLDLIDSAPKFIFQFIGNASSVLNTTQNRNLRSKSKTYSLYNPPNYYDSKSGSFINIGNSVTIPEDLREGRAVSFVVNFGAQEQQMFSNLQVDQSEYQNTEEYYQTITSVVAKQPQTQSASLFTIFTERSYTATIDSLGNLMIQPLMFFELVNIPLFYGNYWITNVKHTITPNDIKTTFKGVRQPVSILPTKDSVLLQLVEMEINSLLDTDVDLDTSGYDDNIEFDGKEALSISTKVAWAVNHPNETGTFTLSTKELEENQLFVLNYFKSRNLSPDSTKAKAIVAGIMGNIQHESSFDPLAYNPKDNNNTTDIGLIQWNSVNAQVYNIILNTPTLKGQLDYLVTKWGGYNQYLKAVTQESSLTPTNAAYLFAWHVEVCYKCNKGYDAYKTSYQFDRSKRAVDFHKRFSDPNDVLYWA